MKNIRSRKLSPGWRTWWAPRGCCLWWTPSSHHPWQAMPRHTGMQRARAEVGIYYAYYWRLITTKEGRKKGKEKGRTFYHKYAGVYFLIFDHPPNL